MEPIYSDIEDNDDPQYQGNQIPKWRIPSTDRQRRLLGAIGCKYWPLGSRKLRHDFIMREKAMTDPEVAIFSIVTPIPDGWFENCVQWVTSKRKSGDLVGLAGFMTLFLDDDSIEEWRRKNANSKQVPDDPAFR